MGIRRVIQQVEQISYYMRLVPHWLRIVIQLALALGATFLLDKAWTPLQRIWPALPFDNAEHWLAVLAISFALVQFVDSKRQEAEMRHIAHSMTTRLIGVFPEALTEITDLASKAQKELCIMSDVLGYGRYTAPALHHQYFEALKTVQRNVKVKLVVCTPKIVEQEKYHNFHEDNFEVERGEPRYTRFFALHPELKQPANAAELRGLLIELDDRDLKGALQDIDARRLGEAMGFFLWIRDDREAVFAFHHQHKANEKVGFSFRTQDGNLIQQFRRSFETKWEEASSQAAPKPAAELPPKPDVHPA